MREQLSSAGFNYETQELAPLGLGVVRGLLFLMAFSCPQGSNVIFSLTGGFVALLDLLRDRLSSLLTLVKTHQREYNGRMRFPIYPAATDVWEFAGERWTVVMTRRLPVGEAVGGLSVDGTYDDGWATLRSDIGFERVVAIPQLVANGNLISGPSVVVEKAEPFDVDELIRYAESYGHPEEWIKKAQELHAKVERLEAELAQAHSFAIENFGAEG